MNNLPGNPMAEKYQESRGLSAEVVSALIVAHELRTANLLSYYATTGTSIYSERQRTELTGRLGIPETPIVPLAQEAAAKHPCLNAAGYIEHIPGGPNGSCARCSNNPWATTDNTSAIPTKAELEAEIEACAQDLWKADPGNNTPARTFSEDYASAQDRYRAMARAALGLHDEPKKEK